MTRFYTYCMLRMPRGWANLRGGREGRVVHLWVSQATILDCTGVKLDTPPAVLVAPNGYRGFEARIYKCGGHQALSHWEGSNKMTVVAGIDVGKANLDVSVSGGPVLRFDNTATGITKLRKHLQEHDTTLAVCEPTGGYERLLTSRLRKTDIGGAYGPPGPGARFRQSLRLRGQNRPIGRPGAFPLRGSVSGGGYVGTGDGPAPRGAERPAQAAAAVY